MQIKTPDILNLSLCRDNLLDPQYILGGVLTAHSLTMSVNYLLLMYLQTHQFKRNTHWNKAKTFCFMARVIWHWSEKPSLETSPVAIEYNLLHSTRKVFWRNLWGFQIKLTQLNLNTSTPFAFITWLTKQIDNYINECCNTGYTKATNHCWISLMNFVCANFLVTFGIAVHMSHCSHIQQTQTLNQIIAHMYITSRLVAQWLGSWDVGSTYSISRYYFTKWKSSFWKPFIQNSTKNFQTVIRQIYYAEPVADSKRLYSAYPV